MKEDEPSSIITAIFAGIVIIALLFAIHRIHDDMERCKVDGGRWLITYNECKK